MEKKDIYLSLKPLTEMEVLRCWVSLRAMMLIAFFKDFKML